MRYLPWILLGLAGGALGGALVAVYAGRQLDQKLATGSAELTGQFGAGRAELDRALAAGRAELDQTVRARVTAQVPPIVRNEVKTVLDSYGLTPATGRRINQALAYAERAGLLGSG